jgi:REP element-mobilizing transposase RayT
MKRDYIDFHDRSVPVGFFITFRTYGSWLHGDKRGSVDRRTFNRFGRPNRPQNTSLQQSDHRMSKAQAFRLNSRLRKLTESAISEVCAHRKVALYSVNVRSNHVHIVISARHKPEQMITAFKAYATRAMRMAGLISESDKVWSRHGSTKYLWTEDQIGEAVAYVKFEQGEF